MYFKTPITQVVKEQRQLKLTKEIIAEETSKDFKLGFSEAELNSLYENLIDELLIEELAEDPNMNGNQKFVQTLSSGRLPSIPLFRLKFDNPQTELFIKLLRSRNMFEKQDLELTYAKFLQIFKNKNKSTTPGSISSSNCNRTSEPKRKKTIESLFVFQDKG